MKTSPAPSSAPASSRSPDGIDAYVGARIQARRQALGLTLSVVADLLGISFQQLRKYETGANRLSASRLHRLAGALDTSVAAFFPHLGGEAPGQESEPGAGSRLGPADEADWRRGWTTDAILVTTEGRAVAANFPGIQPPAVRRAVADLIQALAAA